MQRAIAIIFGSFWGIGFLVLALWAWQRGQEITLFLGMRKPAIGLWAVRCASIGLVAAGEALLVMLVVGSVYRRGMFTNVLGLSAALLFMLSAASAVALGLAGR